MYHSDSVSESGYSRSNPYLYWDDQRWIPYIDIICISIFGPYPTHFRLSLPESYPRIKIIIYICIRRYLSNLFSSLYNNIRFGAKKPLWDTPYFIYYPIYSGQRSRNESSLYNAEPEIGLIKDRFLPMAWEDFTGTAPHSQHAMSPERALRFAHIRSELGRLPLLQRGSLRSHHTSKKQGLRWICAE